MHVWLCSCLCICITRIAVLNRSMYIYMCVCVTENSCSSFLHGQHPSEKADPEHILWVSFEELRRDLIGAVKRIATHISIDITDELAQKVAEASTFTSMKKQFEEMDKINVRENDHRNTVPSCTQLLSMF